MRFLECGGEPMNQDRKNRSKCNRRGAFQVGNGAGSRSRRGRSQLGVPFKLGIHPSRRHFSCVLSVARSKLLGYVCVCGAVDAAQSLLRLGKPMEAREALEQASAWPSQQNKSACHIPWKVEASNVPPRAPEILPYRCSAASL